MHANADTPSRLSLPTAPTDVPLLGDVMGASHVTYPSCGYPELDQELRRIPVCLLCIGTYPTLPPFFQKRNKLSVEDGCILRWSKVIIPIQVQDLLIQELHQTHMGITHMKSLALGYF